MAISEKGKKRYKLIVKTALELFLEIRIRKDKFKRYRSDKWRITF